MPDDATQAAPEEPLSRKRFLRRLAVTVGAAVGVAAVLPAVALASNNCCMNNTQCTGTCPTGELWFYCQCSTGNYCVCSSKTSCYSGPC